MRLSRAERAHLLTVLVKLTEARRTVEDSVVLIAAGRRASTRKAETFLKPLRNVQGAIAESLALIGQMMNSTEEASRLTSNFILESSTMDNAHTEQLAEELIDNCMGPITALDDLVDALEEPPVPPPRHDVRAWVYIENGKIHIEVGKPGDPDADPEMLDSFGVDEVKRAHEFLARANVATGMYASSCFHPDEEGLPADLDVQEWIRKAIDWNG